MSSASNHSYDRSASGVFETIEILADAELSQSGMAATPDAAWKATYYELDGLTLAHISVPTGSTGFACRRTSSGLSSFSIRMKSSRSPRDHDGWEQTS